jgi:dTDP-4-amino-4,6-dideoxygalactose transaminase
MTDIAAGMGIVGLRHYDEVINHTTNCFNLYKELLKDVQGIRVIDSKDGCKNTHWLCTVVVEDRDDFAIKMFDAGIDTNLVQVRNDVFAIFGGKRTDDLPVMNAVEEHYISLPLNMKTTEENVVYICNTIKSGWGK